MTYGYVALRRRLRLSPEADGTGGGNGAGDPPATPPAATLPDDDDDLDESDSAKLKDALRKERQARREAARERNELVKWRQEREKSEREVADAKLKEQSDWEKLALSHESRVKELEGELTKKDRDLIATRIASRYQLPETLAARLQGDDAESIEADAKELAKLVVAATPPVVPPSSGSPANGARPNNGAPLKREDLKGMDWQQITKLKDEGKLKHLLG